MAGKLRGRFKWPLYGVAGLLAAGLVWYMAARVPLGPNSTAPDAAIADARAGVPLDAASPWPKFRANALQNGRSAIRPEPGIGRPWAFATAKGIFSSPVVDGEGTVYIGSADHWFYALNADGTLRWKFLTGEVIDSAALLDDKGRVYVASGDGRVYALDRASGKALWSFRAPTPAELAKEGVHTLIDWFEGNTGMTGDGSLIVPNDNFQIYALDRDTGEMRWRFTTPDMNWSLPAYAPASDSLFFGNVYFTWANFFALDARTGEKRWSRGTLGSMVSSPLIANSRADAIVVAAGYDGYVRAYEQGTGKEIWKFGARDHIYASPAQLSDGTIVIPSADGTIYGLDPAKGRLRWSYDTREPIRSSPAVDGHDRIYAGGGDGRLYCFNGDGTLRWAYQLIGAERNDLNASPALGPTAITIAGESGEIFSVPYDWPLTAEGARDPRSILPGHETVQDGARLYWTEPFGARLDAPAGPVDANRPLAFTLAVREEGRTRAALIDPASVRVEVSGAPRTRVEVSADRQFILAVPEPYWTDARGGKVEVRVSGRYRVDPWRFGLKFFGGREGGRFEQRFTLNVPPREGGFPYRIPAAPGDAAGMLEISRLAVPAPTVLPSYNQIGFDSVHYLLGLVEGNGKHAVVWGVAGRLEGAEGKSVVDPSQDVRFALDLDYEGGLVTLSTHEGFTLKFNGWEMPYDLFRIATRVDPASGAPAGTAAGTYIVKTDEIGIYGPFLKLLGVSDTKTGRMYVAGGANFGPHGSGTGHAPEGVGEVSITLGKGEAVADVTGSNLRVGEHVFGLLLVDAASGHPIGISYAAATHVEAAADGTVARVRVALPDGKPAGAVRAYYMVDTYPAYRTELRP